MIYRKKFDARSMNNFYRLYSERAQFSWSRENYTSSDYK